MILPTSGVVAVTDTAAAVSHGLGGEARLIMRTTASSDTVYLGDSTVTSATGFPLLAADAYEVPIRVDDGKLYVICASGQTADLRYLAVL